MPQASAELQNKMFEYFGSHTDDEGPMKYLESQGHRLSRSWEWHINANIKHHSELSQKEIDCINFMVDEWDFGGAVYVGDANHGNLK